MKAFWVVVVAVVLSGCNVTVQAGGCGPGSCTGCCTSNGQCVVGIEPSACGSTGNACTNCALSGQTCSLGQCVAQMFGGGGGLSGSGGGLPAAGGGVSSAGGGSSGGGSAGSCSTANCQGCCSASGVCEPGRSNAACGSFGDACQVCGEGTCVNEGGGAKCGSAGGGSALPCGPSTCPDGCCTAQGSCLSGILDQWCGQGGQACVDCPVGQACFANATDGGSRGGRCGPLGTGGGSAGGSAGAGGGAGGVAGGGGAAPCSVSCAGCCDATGACRVGDSASACGVAGSACSACSVGTQCSGGSCVSVTGGGAAGGGGFAGGTSGGGATSGGTSGGGSTSGGSAAGGSAGGVVSGNGETCGTAIISATPGTQSGTLTGFLNDYGPGAGCLSTAGADRVYRLQVGQAARVSVTVTPTSSWDVSLSGVVGTARCQASPRTCDASVDNATAGNAETLDLATSGDDVFVVVDSSSTTVGGYTLRWSIVPLAAGDRCEAPFALQSGVPTSGSTSTFTNDYTAGVGCASVGRMGADVVYSIQVPPGQGVDVRVAPGTAMLDTSISIATDVTRCATQCVTGSNTGAAGAADVAFWNNLGASTVTAYVIVDSSSGSSPGPFTVTATVGSQVTCNPARCPTGCCQNNQCVTGTEDTACGQAGAACQTCGQFQQCTNSVCADVPRPTGSPCTLTSQCYSGTLSPGNCRASWPNGGYCSSSCLLDGYDCGGLPLIAPGWCVAGACLAKCASPGTGQSDCRNDYVCEYSAGSGSQGVCVPRCQLVACSARTCQPSGYCR